jgi:hypothetical protein
MEDDGIVIARHDIYGDVFFVKREIERIKIHGDVLVPNT